MISSRSRLKMIVYAAVLCLLFAVMIKPGMISAAVEHTVPQNGLVAYWPLDEGSGTVTAEQTGTVSGRDLTVQGTAAWADGKYGKAFNFDGNTVLAMDGAKAIKAYNLTVSMWFKLESFPASDTGANILVANADLAALDTGAFDFGFFGGGLYAYVVNSFTGGTGDRVDAKKDITDQIKGKWQHLAVIYDTDEGKEFAKIYLNGEEAATSKLTSILGLQIKLGYPKTASYKKCALNFGGYTDTAGVVQRAVKGLVDDIAIYDRALSIDEIKLLAEATAPTAAPTTAPTTTPTAGPTSSPASSQVSSEESSASEEPSAASETSSEEISESGDPSGTASESSPPSQSSQSSQSSAVTSQPSGQKGGLDPTVLTIIIAAAAAILAGGVGWLVISRRK